MDEIKGAWEEFIKISFPEKLAFEERENINFADIDSAAAGCISTYLENRNSIENKCVSILNECASEINKVKLYFDGEEKEYIEKLYALILMVLKRINH